MLYYLFALKRIFVVILALLYFVAGSGMLLRQHYCGGEFVAAQVDFANLAHSEMCDDCGMEEEEDGCCESKTLIVKKTIEQQNIEGQSWDLPFQSFDLLPIFTIPFVPESRIPCTVALQALQKPPPKAIALFKEICCFRI